VTCGPARSTGVVWRSQIVSFSFALSSSDCAIGHSYPRLSRPRWATLGELFVACSLALILLLTDERNACHTRTRGATPMPLATPANSESGPGAVRRAVVERSDLPRAELALLELW